MVLHINLRNCTLNYLGYSTDPSTFYYYYTEVNKNYEETMIGVKNADSIGISVEYVLLDSWWYYKVDNDGVYILQLPNIFPNGMAYNYVHNRLSNSIQAHNRLFKA